MKTSSQISSPLTGENLVIIGGGIAGCSVAELAKDYFKQVTMIDDFANNPVNGFNTNAGSLHNGYGTTGHPHSAMLSRKSPLKDTFRLIRTHPEVSSVLFPPSPAKIFRALSCLYHLNNEKLMTDASAIFHDLQKRAEKLLSQVAKQIDAPTQRGRVALCRSEDYLKKISDIILNAKKEFDISAEILDRNSLIKKLPNLGEGIVGGIYYPDDLSFHPPTFKEVWAQHLSTRINLISDSVTKVEVRNQSVVSITAGNENYRADHYIFCTGAYNHKIMNPYTLPGGGIALDLELEKSSRGKIGCEQVYLPEQILYVFPYDKGRRIRLSSGLFLGKNSLNKAAMKKAGDRMLRSFHQYFNKGVVVKNIQHTFFGSRPLSCDALPIVGKLPYLNNASLLNGLGSYGYTAIALAEAFFFPSKNTPDYLLNNPILSKRIRPDRFSPLWTQLSRWLSPG